MMRRQWKFYWGLGLSLVSAAVAQATTASDYVDAVQPGEVFEYGVHQLKWTTDTNGNRLMDVGEVESQKDGAWQTLDDAGFRNTVTRRRICMYLPNGYIYKQTPTRNLALYVDYPEDWKRTDQRPAMIWFFGGAWSTGNPSAFKPQAAYFSKRGVVGICVDYRIATVDGQGRNDYRAAMDAKTAVRWVRKNAAQLGIDPNQIMAGGDSAGGHVAIATQIESLNDPSDDPSISAQVSALLLHNPYVVRISEESWVFQMDFKTLPPVWISYGLLDKAAYNDDSSSVRTERNGESFIAELQQAGIPLRTYIKAGMNHGFCSGPHLDSSTRDIDQFLQECGLLSAPAAELTDEVSRYPFILHSQAVDAGRVERSVFKKLVF